MAVYLISYNLNTSNQNYDRLYEHIKEISSSWWHHLDSTWLIQTHIYNASQIANILKKEIHDSDDLLVIKVSKDYSGWLPKEAWQWIEHMLS